MSQVAVINEVRGAIEKMAPQFKAALPSHVSVEKFVRVTLTAVQTNPALLDADRRTLFAAATRAAQMGLLPDGREGAIVTKRGRDGAAECEFRAMVAGIMKLVRNSGEISVWSVQAVYENDEFDFTLGDDEFIKHKPALSNRGELIAFYSIVTMKDGEKSREVMGVDDVRAIRDRSDAWKAYKAGKIKVTPWSTDEAEMGKKTIVRRHAKRLPLSTDIDGAIREDDELFMPEPQPQEPSTERADEANEPSARPSRLQKVAASAPVDDDGVIEMPTASKDESPI